MPRTSIVRHLNPWKARREREAERIAALRSRDGDRCARCRREIRFELPPGSDQGAKVEQGAVGRAADPLAGAVLTHGRCHLPGRDDTETVMERLRPAREAALFDKSRDSRAA